MMTHGVFKCEIDDSQKKFKWMNLLEMYLDQLRSDTSRASLVDHLK